MLITLNDIRFNNRKMQKLFTCTSSLLAAYGHIYLNHCQIGDLFALKSKYVEHLGPKAALLNAN